jgi:archaellum component FlaC
MRRRYTGELSEELAQDIEDLVKLYSNVSIGECVTFDKSPAQVGMSPQ